MIKLTRYAQVWDSLLERKNGEYVLFSEHLMALQKQSKDAFEAGWNAAYKNMDEASAIFSLAQERYIEETLGHPTYQLSEALGRVAVTNGGQIAWVPCPDAILKSIGPDGVDVYAQEQFVEIGHKG